MRGPLHCFYNTRHSLKHMTEHKTATLISRTHLTCKNSRNAPRTFSVWGQNAHVLVPKSVGTTYTAIFILAQPTKRNHRNQMRSYQISICFRTHWPQEFQFNPYSSCSLLVRLGVHRWKMVKFEDVPMWHQGYAIIAVVTD